MIPGDVRLCLRCQSKGATACPPVPTQELRIVIENGYADKHIISAHLVDMGFEGSASGTDRSRDLAPSAYPVGHMSIRIGLNQCYVFLVVHMLVVLLSDVVSCTCNVFNFIVSGSSAIRFSINV